MELQSSFNDQSGQSPTDNVQQEKAHERVKLSLNMSLDMEEVGGNGSDSEFENNPEEEEEEVSIPNVKKPR